MDFWRKNAEGIIQNNDFILLQGKGSISKKQMEQLAKNEFIEFETRRKVYEAEQAESQDEQELKELEQKITNRIEG
jgi:hypothetical protein